MELTELAQNWNEFARRDALWAILTAPEKSDNRWTPEEFFATGTAEIRRVIDELDALGVLRRREAALDFGCGVGRLTQALCDHFESAIGTDISAEMIARAREFNRHGSRCRYVVNAAPDLRQLESEAFDFVYSNIVLQHMRPQLARGYIAEFARVLRIGGMLVFQLPAERHRPTSGARAHAAADARPAVATSEPRMEMWGTPRATVETWLRESGASVIQVCADSGAGPEWTSYRYFATRR